MNAVHDTYLRFAEIEARGVSPVYERWARGVAADTNVCELIGRLPRSKRQPNLIFAAARALGAPVAGYDELRSWLLEHWDQERALVMTRSTQTNEAARCAVLLPFFAEVGQPIALIEVGASAGLCLYPDRYSYRYDLHGRVIELDPRDGESDVVLSCPVVGSGFAPPGLPEVASRAGVDLNPLDASDPEQVDWLEALVWPEHEERRARLRRAARVVAEDPPQLVRGDASDEIAGLVAQAPGDASVVVFHSAVLVYMTPDERFRFTKTVSQLPVTWISNEGPAVLPRVTEQVSKDIDGRTIVAINGQARALVGPHGQSLELL